MRLVNLLFLLLAVTSCKAAEVVTLIVPYGAGGATDYLARTVANTIEKDEKINVVIINKPGASSNIGFSTFLECNKNCLLIAGPNIKTNKKYVPDSYPIEIEKIPPLVFLADTPQLLYVRSSLQIKTFLELKQKTQTLVFGHGGKGTLGHKSFEKVCKYFQCQEINYKSGSSAIVDLLGQRIDVISIPAYGSDLLPHDKAVPILVLGRERLANINVPTALEVGYKDIVVESWWMLFERKLNIESQKIIKNLFKSNVDALSVWVQNE